MNGKSFAEREPLVTAGGITGLVALILTAFWGVIADAGALAWLSQGTQGAINAAIIGAVALLSAVWARGRSTSTAAPTLPSGTTVTVTNRVGKPTETVEL